VSKTSNPVTDYTIYKIGHFYRTAWESEKMDVNNPIKFYIEKGPTWDISVKFNGLYTISGKSCLYKLLQFMGIDHNDVALVSKRNLKTIAPLSTNLVDYVNANLKLDFDADDIATYEKYLSGSWIKSQLKDTIKEAGFKALNDCAFKKFILRLVEIAEKMEKRSESILTLMEKKDVKGKAEKMKDADKMETYVFKSLIEGQINPCEALKIMEIWQEGK
jgi:hypothetical protein